MKNKIESFKRDKEFLICVDSDGCVIDSMNIKHFNCFGPMMIKQWNLEDNEELALKIWNRVNLYSMTRGINRFKGLVETFKTLKENKIYIKDLDEIEKWASTTDELSNRSLEIEIKETDSSSLKNALNWSINVNKAIEKLPMAGTFKGAKEAIETASRKADISVVSSANSSAINEEWRENGLIDYVNVLLGQEAGGKAYCINEIININKYERDKALMIGDAIGDLEAALENNILFYPIIVEKEKFSWERFKNEALDKFLNNEYKGEYQEELIKEFKSTFKDKN